LEQTVNSIDHDTLDDALRRSGASWEAAPAHGLLCSRLATEGSGTASDWLLQVLDGVPPDSTVRGECEAMLDTLFSISHQQLAGRQSDFELLLPDEETAVQLRTDTLARWCEGYLHGLVSGNRNEQVRARLATEPLADIIKDMLQITRADVDHDEDEEANEQAFAELVEYVRVSAQLAYEELAETRDGGEPSLSADNDDKQLH
jgi:uncharacterized protein YgfB (UPF0149 family)